MNQATPQKKLKILGIAIICFGLLAILVPSVVGLSVAIVVGLLVAVTGLARIAWAFQSGTMGKSFVMVAMGTLTFIAGLALIFNPVFASGVLTIILTAYFISDGIIEIYSGLLMRPMSGWLWLFGGGMVSVVLGVMILSQFPFSGAWAVGILLGIKMLLIGLIIVNVRHRIA